MSHFIVDDATRLTGKESLLLRRLQEEYTPRLLEEVLKPLVTQTSPVSLRVLDWSVTNFCKENNVVCLSSVPGQTTNVHHAYRSTLAHWKRTLFDPFRRKKRIQVRIGGEVYDTTLGQANFCLWSYTTGVLAYVIGHVDAIEAHMNAVSRQHRKERKAAAKRGVARKRRTELTSAPSNLCIAYVAPTSVCFE